MTRYLLDTNLLSEGIKPQPSSIFLDWMIARANADLFVASLSIGEIRRGILKLPAGRKRNILENWFVGPEGPLRLFAGRILSFDEQAAHLWAQLMIDGQRRGRPRDALDTIIGATAATNGCIIATANEDDFDGLDVFNPMRQSD